ncbi:MAG: hypothetical protein V1243_06490, partial [Arenicellales bacterium]|nr:hypothetical protein [Arenicellales bacterium]
MFTESQREILSSAGLDVNEDQAALLTAVIDDPQKSTSLNNSELIGFLEIANFLYRAGDQIISDQ